MLLGTVSQLLPKERLFEWWDKWRGNSMYIFKDSAEKLGLVLLQRGRQRMRRLDGCESEWIPRVGDAQGGLVCCDSWGCKESDTTEWLNWTDVNWSSYSLIANYHNQWLHYVLCFVAQLCLTLCDPMDYSLPGFSVHGEFSRQESSSGLPCPPPGDLTNPGIKPRSPALQTDSLSSEPPGKPNAAF